MTAAFDLDAFLPYRLNRAAEWVSRRFAVHYKSRYGLTRPEWRTLAALGALGRLTATEVGAHSSMHKTKVSRAVRALEVRRWLKRSENESDRRIEHLELTPLGRRRYEELAGIALDFDAQLAGLLGGTRVHQLDAGLAAIEAAMRAPPAAASRAAPNRHAKTARR